MARGHMGRNEAAFDPVAFTHWDEYAAGINPELGVAIDKLLHDAAPFGDEVVARL